LIRPNSWTTKIREGSPGGAVRKVGEEYGEPGIGIFWRDWIYAAALRPTSDAEAASASTVAISAPLRSLID